MRVVNGAMALGKKYSGSLRVPHRRRARLRARHRRRDPQAAAQSARRGADQARVFLGSRRPADEGAGRRSGYLEHLYVRLRRRQPDAADGHALARHRARLGAGRRYARVHARTEAAIRTSSCNRSARSGRRRTRRSGSIENHNFLPAWSPDGTKLAFMSNRDGNPEIYIVNRDGTNLRRITNHPNADVTPTWSPSGTQLAFTSDRSGLPQVYIVNVDGTGLDRISAESRCDRATWSRAERDRIRVAEPAADTRSDCSASARANRVSSPTASAATRARRSRRTAATSRSCPIAPASRRSTRSRATAPTSGRSRRRAATGIRTGRSRFKGFTRGSIGSRGSGQGSTRFRWFQR